MFNVTAIFNDALAALNNKDLKRAEQLFKRVIEIDNSHVPALNLVVVVLMSMERFAEAESFIARATSLNQRSDVSFYNYGLIAKRLNKPQLALENFSRALSLNSNVADTWNNRGTVFNDLEKYDLAIADFDRAIFLNAASVEAYTNKAKSLARLKRYDEALPAYDKALSLKADLAEAWLGRGGVFSDLKRYDEAFAAYDKVLSIRPDLAEAWLGRGRVFLALRRYDEALAAYDHVLSTKPDAEGAWLGRGNACWSLNRHDEALAAYDKAMAIKPDSENAWLGRGNVFWSLRRYDEALAAYDKALSIKPDLDGAWLGRGNILWSLRRFEEAFAAYGKALSIQSDLENAWLGLGNLLADLRRYDEAHAAYDKALSIRPDLAEAWLGRGNVFWSVKRYEEAFAAYDQALSIRPDLEGVEGSRLKMKMEVCNWDKLHAEIDALTKSIRAGKANCAPIGLLSLTDLPDDHLRCAQAWVAAKHPTAKPIWENKVYRHEKIRLGYVSSDLYDHAIGHLTAELFELHDKSRFLLTAFSLGRDDKSAIRRRLVDSFDRFIDCTAMSDFDVARAIADCEIDILVDVNGFTQEGRTNIFAHRPAPIQVNYLGYPGTMGAPYVDYIVGDKTLFGAHTDASVYSERLVRLPHCYQPNDRKRQISTKAFTRQEMRLPDGKFVFCCFNNNYKILPDTFDRWMRILRRVEGGVLWLLAENPTAMENLRKEARNREIDPARLVFANRMELSEHLARHRLADLFVDTLPYNAHTTASDALWAGLPVLTQVGTAFAGRVAASLLTAVDLPELVTHSPDEYEALAIELALNKARLESLREKLSRNRLTAPLFDTPLYARHLEAAYEAMYQRYQAGLPPDHIEIEPLSR
jgi:protein O-GlcNAc transferase